MSTGDVFGLLTVVAGLVAMAGISAGVYLRHLAFQEHELEHEIEECAYASPCSNASLQPSGAAAIWRERSNPCAISTIIDIHY